MYRAFVGGYRLIGERAMLQPSYSLPTSLGSESIASQPLYMNTLPGTTSVGIPMAEIYHCASVGPNTY